MLVVKFFMSFSFFFFYAREKTLSVLEIINSLDDDVVAVPPYSTAPHHTADKRFHPSLRTANTSNAISNRIGFTNRPVKFGEVGGTFKSGEGHFITRPFLQSRQIKNKSLAASTKLGGSGRFGKGFYSASQVVSGMTSPKLGHSNLHGTVQSLLTGPRAGENIGRITRTGKSVAPHSGLRETDENLEIFELKRHQLKNAAAVEEEEDVIDLILSRRGLGVNADEGDNFSVDLSAVYDDDADSNLDEIVRALEEEEQEADVGFEHLYSRGNDKVGKLRRTNSAELQNDGLGSDEDDDDDFEQNGLLAMIVRNMDHGRGNERGSDNADNYDDDDDADDDDDDNLLLDDNIQEISDDAQEAEVEELEESQILEDVFFVQ